MTTRPIGFVVTSKPSGKEVMDAPANTVPLAARLIIDPSVLAALLLVAVILLSATLLVQAARR